jgi:hypothetical protein
MDYRFNADEWENLSHNQRAHRCRVMADEARKLAITAAELMNESYLSIAPDWEKLANELELISS